jgi:hypothetical protein
MDGAVAISEWPKRPPLSKPQIFGTLFAHRGIRILWKLRRNRLGHADAGSAHVLFNRAVCQELQALGLLEREAHLSHARAALGYDRHGSRLLGRSLSGRYIPAYVRGGKEHDIERDSYAQVVATNPKENLVAVRKDNEKQIAYEPSRLRGISACREIERQLSATEPGSPVRTMPKDFRKEPSGIVEVSSLEKALFTCQSISSSPGV